MNLFEGLGIVAVILISIFGVNFLNKFLAIFNPRGGTDESIKKDIHDLTDMSAVDKARIMQDLFNRGK